MRKSKVNPPAGGQKSKHGFTLIEILVVLGILSVLTVIFVEIFFRTLRGSNEAQTINIVKQNGQVALETMDKAIRNSDKVICVSSSSPSDSLVIQKDGNYTRFKFNAETTSANGFISVDSLNSCNAALIVGWYTSLTNTDITNGASIKSGGFSLNSQGGYNDLVTIDFIIGPAINIPKTLTFSAQPIKFTTTVELR